VNVLPLLTEDEKVTAAESEKLYKLLRKHGIPERSARNLIKIYQEG
jgi:endonuclease III